MVIFELLVEYTDTTYTSALSHVRVKIEEVSPGRGIQSQDQVSPAPITPHRPHKVSPKKVYDNIHRGYYFLQNLAILYLLF